MLRKWGASIRVGDMRMIGKLFIKCDEKIIFYYYLVICIWNYLYLLIEVKNTCIMQGFHGISLEVEKKI